MVKDVVELIWQKREGEFCKGVVGKGVKEKKLTSNRLRRAEYQTSILM